MLSIGYALNERYQLKRLIGSGGTAHVYLADDLYLKREVSVKVLRFDFSDDERALERFYREARAISELSHENIVSLYDVDNEGGYHYLVMEYVDGMDLKKYLKLNYPLSLLEVIDMMQHIVHAVDYAHKRGIIHRDLKPQNILISRDGQLKITDFGIAKGLNEVSMTQTNTLVGSIHYLSPEQTRGKVATKQSDIYALGIVFYELIMGNVPFIGDSPVSIAMKHFQEPIPSVVKYAKQEVPQSVENIILKACAKQSHNRYTSAQDMLLALKCCMDVSMRNVPKYVEEVVNDHTVVMNKPLENKTNLQQATTPQTPKKKSFLWVWLSALLLIVIGGLIVSAMILSRKPDVVIPDLVNQTQAHASKVLTDLGLSVSEVSYENHETIAKDMVIRTDPKADTSVKAESSVKLIVSSGKAAKVMKNYVSQDYDVAYQELVSNDFVVERVEEVSTSVPKGKVISQSIAAGTSVIGENTIIRLTVSSGAVSILDYRGKAYEAIAQEVKALGISTEKTEEESFVVAEGHVISQSIAPNTKVDPKTTTITFKVATTPDLTGMNVTSAQSKLATFDSVRIEVKEIYSNTVEKNVVIKQDVSKVSGQTLVTLTVSKGKQTVMPNLIGATQSFAQSQLASLNLKVVYVTKVSATYPKGTVSEQSISAGTILTDGQTITITLSSGQE